MLKIICWLLQDCLVGSSLIFQIVGYLGSFYLTHNKAYSFKLTSLTKTFAVAKNQKHALQTAKFTSVNISISNTATDKMASKIRKAAGVSDEWWVETLASLIYQHANIFHTNYKPRYMCMSDRASHVGWDDKDLVSPVTNKRSSLFTLCILHLSIIITGNRWWFRTLRRWRNSSTWTILCGAQGSPPGFVHYCCEGGGLWSEQGYRYLCSFQAQ